MGGLLARILAVGSCSVGGMMMSLSGRYSIIRPFGPKEMTEEYSFGVTPYHMKGSGEETVIHQRSQGDLTHVD